MTLAEKLALLKKRTDETDEAILSFYLDLAERDILNRCYPYDPDKTGLPAKYELKQIEIAAYRANKDGADGQTMQIENGVHRRYEAGDLPPSMLADIVPFCGVIR